MKRPPTGSRQQNRLWWSEMCFASILFHQRYRQNKQESRRRPIHDAYLIAVVPSLSNTDEPFSMKV